MSYGACGWVVYSNMSRACYTVRTDAHCAVLLSIVHDLVRGVRDLIGRRARHVADRSARRAGRTEHHVGITSYQRGRLAKNNNQGFAEFSFP